MKTLHIVAIASLLSAGGAFWLARTTASTAIPTDDGSSQAQIEARLARLEDALAQGRPAAADRTGGGAPPAFARASGPPTQRSAAQPTRAQGEAEFAKLEPAFRAQPINAAWAVSAESVVLDAFGSKEAARMGVVAPSDPDVQCRSNTCRINATYADEGAAADAAQMLLMDIAQKLPNARSMMLLKPDGRTELIVYASAPSAKASTGSGR